MRFVLSKVLVSLVRVSALLALFVSPFVWSDDNQPSDPGQQITVESHQSFHGTCNKLIVAGDDHVNACGQNLVVITMTNGSASITVQQGNQDLGLYGSETNSNLYTIYGAFVNGTDNIPLQGGCEKVAMINGENVFVCTMVDEQGSPWEIQFTVTPD